MATANIDISDPSKWKSFGEAAPEWIENVKTSGDYDMGAFPDIPSLRAFMESNKAAAGKVVPPPPEGVREEDLKITMRDGHEITVRVHRPEPPPPEGSPLAVVYHGGKSCLPVITGARHID
jgi:acetyl esterase/lipase